MTLDELTRHRTALLAGGNVIRQGIEFDRIGRRLAYHFLRRHPGDVTDPGVATGVAGETVRIPASEIIYVIDPVDAGQLRGVSKFAPAIVKCIGLDLIGQMSRFWRASREAYLRSGWNWRVA